jgi:hypothetical protein
MCLSVLFHSFSCGDEEKWRVIGVRRNEGVIERGGWRERRERREKRERERERECG